MKGSFFRAFTRNFNLSWVFGVYIMFVYVSQAYAAYLCHGHFSDVDTVIASGTGLFAMSLGITAFFLPLGRFGAERYSYSVKSSLFFLYLACLVGMVCISGIVAFFICYFLFSAALGYGVALMLHRTARVVRFDRYIGLITGFGILLAPLFLYIFDRLFSLPAALIVSSGLAGYIIFRPPIFHYKEPVFYPRSRQSQSCEPCAKEHMAVAALLVLAVSFLSALRARWDISADPVAFMLAAGIGGLSGGLLRDALDEKLRLLPPSLSCAVLVILPLLRSSFRSAGLLFCMFCLGAVMSCAICDGFELNRERDSETQTPAMYAFLIFIPGPAFVLAHRLAIMLPSSWVIFLFALCCAGIALRCFFGCIESSRGSAPVIPYSLRLADFCERHELSSREREVLDIVISSSGKSLKEISGELFISDRTLEKHMSSIYRKTSAKNRTELAHNFASYNP